MNAPPFVYGLADRARRAVWRAWGPITVGVHGIVPDGEGRVLLVRHTYGDSYWRLPGGGVHRRESLVAALHRELREEVGVVVTGPVRLLGAYSSLEEGKSDHVAVFVADEWRRTGSDSPEISECRFFPCDALPDGVSPATARRVEEWRAGEPATFDW